MSFSTVRRSLASLVVAGAPVAFCSEQEEAEGRQLFGVVHKFDSFPVASDDLPKQYCGKFEIGGMHVDLDVKLMTDHSADITASVEDFMMQCKEQTFDFKLQNGEFDMLASMDPHTNEKVNCLKTQFENLDQDCSDLVISWKKTHDKAGINLFAPNLGNVLLEDKETCKEIKVEELPRRLTQEQVDKLRSARTQPAMVV